MTDPTSPDPTSCLSCGNVYDEQVTDTCPVCEIGDQVERLTERVDDADIVLAELRRRTSPDDDHD